MILFRRLLPLIWLTIAALCGAHDLVAQNGPRVGPHEVFVNSESERYLRVLQLAGQAGWGPWSIRSFSPRDITRMAPHDTAHVWGGTYTYHSEEAAPLELIAPTLQGIVNSAFPAGDNDGALWAGRGLTLAGSAGIAGSYGFFSYVFAPVFFWSQNAAFELTPNGRPEEERFRNARGPGRIDLPQRFGDSSYTRIDPGQSTLRVDIGPVAAGVSTANQHWGPAVRYPIVLGNNAPGFVHAFAGSAEPLNLGIGWVHGRVTWGALEESAYSPADAANRRRFMAGLVGAFTPRWFPGLEVGLGRFFHDGWPEGGIGQDEILKPFEGFLKSSLPETGHGSDGVSSPDNQLASVFARWIFPQVGFEVYTEFGREDHNLDLRDFLIEPDHDSAYLLGLQKVWNGDGRPTVLRAEVVNSRITHLVRGRHQVWFYGHSAAVQGHTHRGQLLGSPAVLGGAGATLAVDRYHEGGRWTVELERIEYGEVQSSLEQGEPIPLVDALEVGYRFGFERLFFRSGMEILGGLKSMYDMNRAGGAKGLNLNAILRIRLDM